MNEQLPAFDSLWDYDDPRATERAFRALLPTARAADRDDYLAELLTQIARTQGLQRAFDAAHQTLDEVETLLRPEHVPARVRYLLERGRVLNSAGQPAQARDFFLQAWQRATEAGEDFHAIDAAHMLAIAESPAHQLEWHQRALDLAERSADARARRWRGSLLNNLGWTYHALGRYEEALACFQQTLSYYQEQENDREARIAVWCSGRVLRSLGRLDEALDLQRDLLERIAVLGEQDGYACEEIGECLLALGRRDEARGYFARAYAQLSRDVRLVATEGARLDRLKALAAV